MSLEDAFNVLILASFNGAAPHKLELVGGNEDDRAIYYQAIKAFNESVSENMRFRLDPELAQYVENALPANNEMAAFMNRVQPDKTGVAANHGNVPPSPTIIPDAEAGSQNPQGKEPKDTVFVRRRFRGVLANPKIRARDIPYRVPHSFEALFKERIDNEIGFYLAEKLGRIVKQMFVSSARGVQKGRRRYPCPILNFKSILRLRVHSRENPCYSYV